ncbi:MAG: hypothetical protein SFY80_12790 [Verrucomicrobiota bacterium]|nr:hypothetical protein [Verrucomicrobiota bacterium]
MNKGIIAASSLTVVALAGWILWGNAQSSNKVLTTDLAKAKATIALLEDKTAALEQQSADLDRNLKDRDASLATTHEKLALTQQSLEDTIARARADEDERLAKIDNLNQELLKAVEARKTVEERMIDLQKRMITLTAARQSAEERVAQLEAQNASYEERMLALNDLQRIKSEMIRLQDENAVLVARLQKYESRQSKTEEALLAVGGTPNIPNYIYRSSNYKRHNALSLKTKMGKGFAQPKSDDVETAVTTKE